MTRFSLITRARMLRSPRAGALLLLAVLFPGGAVRAQQPCPLCPTPEVSVTVLSRQVDLLWPEVPTTDGRVVSNVTLSWAADSAAAAASSDVMLLGSYALDCDYRLRMTRVPEPVDAESLVTRIRYEVRENTEGTGAAVATDTIRVAQPDSVFMFAPAIAGSIGVTFTSNVQQPSAPLGSVPVTISGLNTSNAILTTYSVRAVNTVMSLSDGLMVEVRGPLETALPPIVSLTVDTPGTVFPVMNGMEIAFGAGAAAAGDSTVWIANFLFPPTGAIDGDLEAFEGYHVWRSKLPDLEQFALMGEIRQCESKFDFILIDEQEFDETDIALTYSPGARSFQLTDFSVHDNFSYRYAVSTFDRGFLGNDQGATFEGTLAKTGTIYPSSPTADASQAAYVVPNPYKNGALWESGGARVVFANLPTECTIRIFTEAADIVATIQHGPNEPQSTSPTSREWNLTSDNGVDLAPGIYIFYIEGPGVDPQTSKLIIIR